MLIVLVIIVMAVFTTSFQLVVKDLVVVPLELASMVLRKSADHMLGSIQSLQKHFGSLSDDQNEHLMLIDNPVAALDHVTGRGNRYTS
jgi:hypothetical protein